MQLEFDRYPLPSAVHIVQAVPVDQDVSVQTVGVNPGYQFGIVECGSLTIADLVFQVQHLKGWRRYALVQLAYGLHRLERGPTLED
jgi:hypothetical protein